MKQIPRNSLAKALVVAVFLHGAAAAVLAWCVAGRLYIPAGSTTCEFDVTVAPQGEGGEAVAEHVAPPTPWVPPQQSMDLDSAAIPSFEPPVCLPEHVVPHCIAAPALPVSRTISVPAAEAPNSRSDPYSFAAEMAVVCGDGPVAISTNEVGRGGVDPQRAIVVREAVRPRYPVSARMRGQEGLVAVVVETDSDGRARNVTVTAPSGYPALDSAAVDAALRTRFASTLAGAPASGKVSLSFRFRLVD